MAWVISATVVKNKTLIIEVARKSQPLQCETCQNISGGSNES